MADEVSVFNSSSFPAKTENIFSFRLMENEVIGRSGALEDRRLKLIRVFSKPV